MKIELWSSGDPAFGETPTRRVSNDDGETLGFIWRGRSWYGPISAERVFDGVRDYFTTLRAAMAFLEG